MPDETVVAPKRRGRPPKHTVETVAAVTLVREICQWCSTEIQAGQNPPILGICATCKKIEDVWKAEIPCSDCGGRKAVSVAGVLLKDGHRDNCITRAQAVPVRRKFTEQDFDEIRKGLGPAPVPLE